MKKCLIAMLLVAAVLDCGTGFAQNTAKHRTARKVVAGCPTTPVRHRVVRRHHVKPPTMHEQTIYVDSRSSTAIVDIDRGKVYVNDSEVTTLKNPRYEKDKIVIRYITPPPAPPVTMDVLKDNDYTGNKQPALLGVVTCSYCGDGAMVDEVLPCGPADKAGLDYGDVITKVNDKDINTKQELKDALGTYNAGDNVTITYMRWGQTKTTEAALAEKDKVENCGCPDKETESSCNSCYTRRHRW